MPQWPLHYSDRMADGGKKMGVGTRGDRKEVRGGTEDGMGVRLRIEQCKN